MRKGILMPISLLGATLAACSLPFQITPTTPPGVDQALVAVWVEARRIGEDGTESEPDDPLHVAFFSDGTFKAVFESHRFETFHDFWGDWAADGNTLALTIANGNNLPQQSEYQGRFEVQEGELTLTGIVLVDDFAGPTMVFTYHGPEPEGRTVP